jgi:hypothetical protein
MREYLQQTERLDPSDYLFQSRSPQAGDPRRGQAATAALTDA